MRKGAEKNGRQAGQILILSLFFAGILLALIGSLVSYWLVQISHHRQALGRAQALSIAEAGIEMAIWKLNNQPGYNGETNTAYGAGTYNVYITNIGGTTKQVRAEAYVPNASSPRARRVVQATLVVGTVNVGFNYGVQVGDGGLTMDNNSIINGNIYSNGDIIGSAGAQINGDAFVAGPTGKIDSVYVQNNSHAHFLEDSSVGGNANHDTITRSNVGGYANANALVGGACTISGDAFFNSNSGCSVLGTSNTPNPAVPPDPASEPLPVTDDQINQWEQEAEAGGTLAGGSFDSMTLGPKKIVGDLNIINNAVITVTGTIWVTGNIIFNNNSQIRLDPAYGPLSGVIVAGTEGSSSAGTITTINNAVIEGSGTEGSYLMLLSQKTGTSTPAILVRNNAAGAIFYAGNGLIDVANNGGAKELTGYRVHLNNNSTITYESGLANANFSSGPGGGWQMSKQTWQLLQ